MAKTTFGVVQFACTDSVDQNVATATRLVREAAGAGAQIVLVQELFEDLYFCQEEKAEHFAKARTLDQDHPTLKAMRALAAELGVVLPVSLFERANQAYYNSLVMVDADGGVLGLYRKSHIPDGPGYEEKFYFRPGDTGFKVWPTRFGTIGVGICWDQWFPEAARSMALMGADALLYPTAIGSEPATGFDSMEHWRTVMRGHAGANIMPVMAANRIGVERFGEQELTFYGSSFVAGQHGELLAEAGRSSEAVLTASFDLEAIRAERAAWGLFRDRRPELYGRIATGDGSLPLR